MAPTSCFTRQVHRLPDAPQSYEAMISRAKAAPPQSRSANLIVPPDEVIQCPNRRQPRGLA
jgi:hypothetical protein